MTCGPGGWAKGTDVGVDLLLSQLSYFRKNDTDKMTVDVFSMLDKRPPAARAKLLGSSPPRRAATTLDSFYIPRAKSASKLGAWLSIPTMSSIPLSEGSAMENSVAVRPTTASFAGRPLLSR